MIKENGRKRNFNIYRMQIDEKLLKIYIESKLRNRNSWERKIRKCCYFIFYLHNILEIFNAQEKY